MMVPGAGAVVVRALAVVPVILLVLYAMLLGLLGLLCGPMRRRYVTNLNQQALSTASMLMHGPAASPRPGTGQAADCHKTPAHTITIVSPPPVRLRQRRHQ
jgi:hypothetical protein